MDKAIIKKIKERLKKGKYNSSAFLKFKPSQKIEVSHAAKPPEQEVE